MQSLSPSRVQIQRIWRNRFLQIFLCHLARFVCAIRIGRASSVQIHLCESELLFECKFISEIARGGTSSAHIHQCKEAVQYASETEERKATIFPTSSVAGTSQSLINMDMHFNTHTLLTLTQSQMSAIISAAGIISLTGAGISEPLADTHMLSHIYYSPWRTPKTQPSFLLWVQAPRSPSTTKHWRTYTPSSPQSAAIAASCTNRHQQWITGADIRDCTYDQRQAFESKRTFCASSSPLGAASQDHGSAHKARKETIRNITNTSEPDLLIFKSVRQPRVPLCCTGLTHHALNALNARTCRP